MDTQLDIARQPFCHSRVIHMALTLGLECSLLLPSLPTSSESIVTPGRPWARVRHSAAGGVSTQGPSWFPSMAQGKQGSAQHGQQGGRATLKVMLIATLHHQAGT